MYVDTDFFVALMKPGDWLKNNAQKILKAHKNDLWTSATTIIGLLLLAKRFSLDEEKLVVDAFNLVKIRDAKIETYLLAAHFMKKSGANVFDSLHAAHCNEDVILSSGRIFDRIGIRREKLELE